MAPLLLTHFRARHRSIITSLFSATFLGAVIVVTFPCPARSVAHLEGNEAAGSTLMSRKDVVVMMNERGRRKFIEE